MYTSGIVRRIDDLGRIVIPKEVRKSLRIKNGENLEILVQDDNILLKKYSVMKSVEDFASYFTDTIYALIKCNVFITNNDTIIAGSGPLKKMYINKDVSKYLEECLSKRSNVYEKNISSINITDENKEEGSYFISPIIASGDPVGLVILFSKEDSISDSDKQICGVVTKFLSKYLDD